MQAACSRLWIRVQQGRLLRGPQLLHRLPRCCGMLSRLGQQQVVTGLGRTWVRAFLYKVPSAELGPPSPARLELQGEQVSCRRSCCQGGGQTTASDSLCAGCHLLFAAGHPALLTIASGASPHASSLQACRCGHPPKGAADCM